MIPLTEAVDDYLAMRRALGYQLTEHGRVLPQFAAFLAQRSESLITTELALEFATQPADASVVWWHQRLAIVRGFARYLQAFDARHEVPPVNLLPATFHRTRPYLFSEAEIEALLEAARSMRPPLRAASCEALIGLLAVSGMRVSEACGLDRSDVELHEGRLTVRHAKNGRSREIPLHPTTVAALDRYVRARDELCPHPKDAAAFFLSGWGGRLTRHFVWKWFDQLRHATSLDEQTLGRRARLHDVRHAYVLRILLGWYRDGRDIEARLPLLSTVLGHVHPADTFWYIEGAPELLALACERLERTWEEESSTDEPSNTQARMPLAWERSRRAATSDASREGPAMSALAPLLQTYFTERLARQRDASPHTIASYRDSFRLLLTFLHEQTDTPPSRLQLEDLNPERITAFLSHLENERSNGVRTRNARLTAIHSFFQFAAFKAPECSEQIARVLSIPEKRYQSTLISYLTKPEIDALLAAPGRSTPTGRRDHALLLLAVQTGLRASELASLRYEDLNLDTGAWVRCDGKGRKERCTPLTRPTVQVLRVWLRELGGDPAGPLFPSRTGGEHLTRAGIWRLVAKHTTTARARCPSLATKNITPHSLRHTAAMQLLGAPDPVDTATIALWLGHETLDTTNKYLHADMDLKRRAVDRTTPPNIKPGRYRPPDRLLAFLESL